MMSVIITNVSEHDDVFGRNDYVVSINRKPVATFKHERRNGLAECLRAAADAVEKQREDMVFLNALRAAEAKPKGSRP